VKRINFKEILLTYEEESLQNITSDLFLELSKFDYHTSQQYYDDFNIKGPYQIDRYKIKKESVSEEYLPPLAIVMNINQGYVKHYGIFTSIRNCYCIEWGIPCYVEMYALQRDRHIHWNKIRTLLKYLPHFKWVIWMGADLAFVNRNNSITQFLDESYDVILQYKTTIFTFPLIDAEVIIIKNSFFGRQFLYTWMSFSDNRKDEQWANYDNGVLHLTVLRFIKSYSKECDDYFDRSNEKFSGKGYEEGHFCFNKTYSNALSIGKEAFINGGEKIKLLQDNPPNRIIQWAGFPISSTDIVVHSKDVLSYAKSRDIYCL